MRNLVTKVITNIIHKKLGYNVNVQINDVTVSTSDGKVYIHADVDANLNESEVVKIVKSAGLF